MATSPPGPALDVRVSTDRSDAAAAPSDAATAVGAALLLGLGAAVGATAHAAISFILNRTTRKAAPATLDVKIPGLEAEKAAGGAPGRGAAAPAGATGTATAERERRGAEPKPRSAAASAPSAPPLSKAGLRAHLQSTGSGGASPEAAVFIYHAHVCASEEHAPEELERFYMDVKKAFAGPGGAPREHSAVAELNRKPAGPFTVAQFELTFDRSAMADVLAWLEWHRPPALSVLIHPLTLEAVADHSSRILWLGRALPDAVRLDFFRGGGPASQETFAARVRSGEDVASVLWDVQVRTNPSLGSRG